MKRTVIRLATACAALVVALPAWCAEWAIEPSVESHASMTDNINLQPDTHDSVYGLAISPRVTFARRTENSDVAGKASVTVNRYPGNAELDATDASLALTSKYTTERNTLGLALGFIRDSTLESELAATGVVQIRHQRNLLTASPSWNYALTDRTVVVAEYEYDRADYGSAVGLDNYTTSQVTTGLQYAVSERTVATLMGSYSQYRTDSGSVDAKTYGINTGLTWAATERINVTASVGAKQTKLTVRQSALLCPVGPVILCEFAGIPLERFTASNTSRDTGLAFSTTVDYGWEASKASVTVSRDLNPIGSGLVVKTDRLAFQGNHDFSERWSANAGASYLVSRYIGGLGSDTTYYRLDVGGIWKFAENWEAGLNYGYQHQKVDGFQDSAQANTVFLSVSYKWPKISVSR